MESKSKNNLYIDKVVLGIFVFLSIVYIGGSSKEYFDGIRELYFPITVFISVVIGLGLSYIEFKKNKEEKNIKWILAIVYCILYTITLWTTDVVTTYAIGFIYIVAFLLYNDYKLITYVSIWCAVTIIVFLFIQASKGNTSDILVISCETLVLIPLSIIVSKNMSKMNADIKNSLLEIERNSAHQQEMVDQIINITENVSNDFDILNNIMNECNDSTVLLNEAISEISMGALETTKEIEEQTIAIDEIKNSMEEIVISNKEVNECSQNTQEAVNRGLEKMKNLSDKSKAINEKNKQVSESMKELESRFDNIATIIDILTSISEQTNLLALNAAIEAARVGEAGKGFTVVAEEITNLANESKDNAESIRNILLELQSTTVNSVKKVEELHKENVEQEAFVLDATKAFGLIRDNVDVVKDKINLVSDKMNDSLENTNTVYSSISNLLAIAEETTANSEQTNNVSNSNLEKMKSVQEKFDYISEMVNKMKKYL